MEGKHSLPTAWGEKGAGGETLRPAFFLRELRRSFDFKVVGEGREGSGRSETGRCLKLLGRAFCHIR